MPDTTITDLPNASTPLTGSERVPMDQSGVTRDASTQQIANLADSAITAAVSAHEAALNPHPGYALESSLGTAALLDVGTGSNQVVQLDGSSRLPAVDGSQLTNLPGGVGATDLSYTAATRLLQSSTGADVVLPEADGSNAGLMSSAEHVKLLGIEASATADQTGAEIKALYEAQANTNAFTDAEQAKLLGIEAGADVTDTTNVTAAGALMDSEVANLAAVKAFDPTDYIPSADAPTGDIVGTTDTQTISNKELADVDEVVTAIVDGAGVVLDPRPAPSGQGSIATWNIGANNRTATLANWNAGRSMLLVVTVTTGSLTITGADWGDTGAPTLVNGENHIQLYQTGSTVHAVAGWKKAA